MSRGSSVKISPFLATTPVGGSMTLVSSGAGSVSGSSEPLTVSSNFSSRNLRVSSSLSAVVSLSSISGKRDCARGYISSSSAGTGPKGLMTTGV